MAPPEGKVCWVEIPVRVNLAKLKAFYAAIFPNWNWKDSESPGIVTWTSAADGIGGGLVTTPPDCGTAEQPMGTGFTVYFFVDSIEEAIARIEKHGGKLVLPKTPQGDGNFFANLVDIEGNRFGIFQVSPSMA